MPRSLRSFAGMSRINQLLLAALIGATLTSCQSFWQQQADSRPETAGEGGDSQPIAVDVAIARPGKLQPDMEYIGTTAPVRQVSLRSQVEGQLQALTVDVGDSVRQGQVLARLDDDLLVSSVNQVRAEKAAQYSAVISAQSQVGDARIKVEQARLQLQQAQADILRLEASLKARIEEARLEAQQTKADAARQEKLALEGATAAQQAEQAQTKAEQAQQSLLNQQVSAQQQIAQAKTAAETAAKILRSAEAQVDIERQKVSAARAQVSAQRASFEQAKTRQTYAVLRSPITGKVLSRASEPGNLVQPGTEILQLGDFSRIKINVEVSELQLSKLKLGQKVPVKLDAFPTRQLTGTITRISPAADPTARLIPLEITLNNPGGDIGSGLLARVRFPQEGPDQIAVPESALEPDSTLFVLRGKGKQTTVRVRPVRIGSRAGGKVKILGGLSPGERYVTRSSKPLKDGQPVRLSALSTK